MRLHTNTHMYIDIHIFLRNTHELRDIHDVQDINPVRQRPRIALSIFKEAKVPGSVGK